MPHNTFYTQSGARVVIYFEITKNITKKLTNISKMITFLGGKEQVIY